MGGSKADILERLEQAGYYRLSGYWHDYRRLDGEGFREGTTIDAVWSDYVFDRQFRLAVLDAVERVEVYTRARLAHKLAHDVRAKGIACSVFQIAYRADCEVDVDAVNGGEDIDCELVLVEVDFPRAPVKIGPCFPRSRT
ncbi:Abi family protein [Xiamenia xianingshaonis]|uniref:Uncharacterized protein n=1 Tax=Xiamenia xianingshaonis TaxID=2682776 RepID=A0ABX0IG65_9ACTN|nr:Abi family protein [Xiamenia xianingshaonis]NHM13598.1 hypothetical protein [Xiamenia xianingshaonis]